MSIVTMRESTVSRRLYGSASDVLAAGVSSDARRPLPGRVPLFVDRAEGAHLIDVDGNDVVDYVLGQGPMILGHSASSVVSEVIAQVPRGQAFAAQHRLEAEVANLVVELVPCADLVRFNSVGSEAVHGAWRLARGFTGRPLILKFEGHYHGWLDPELVSVHPNPDQAGPARAPHPTLQTGGQAQSVLGDLLVAPWNDQQSFDRIVKEHAGQIAAVVLEPVLCNSGCIAPRDGFLEYIRAETIRNGILLIFDEVITGFRLSPGGAQQYLGVTPDLAVFGKAMAGGFPVSCIAGRADVMSAISDGRVGHAGTFNSNPVGMAAALATLREIRAGGEGLYEGIRARGKRLAEGLVAVAADRGVPMVIESHGTVFQTYVAHEAPGDYREFARTGRAAMAELAAALLERCVNIVPRGLWFLSAAHSDADVDYTLTAFGDALDDEVFRRSLAQYQSERNGTSFP